MAWNGGSLRAARSILACCTRRPFSSGCKASSGGGSSTSLLFPVYSGASRCYSSQPPPLSVALPNIPQPTCVSGHKFEFLTFYKCTQHTAVVVEAGCRFEAPYPSGVTHFLEKLAYNSTVSMPRAGDIVSMFERHGGVWDAQSSRDLFIYAANSVASVEGVNDVLGLIADTALRPRITDEELSVARKVVEFDVHDSHERPDCEAILTDWIHQAAYRNNTLGLPKLCPLETLERIDRNTLLTYMAAHYTPKRMVVVGIGCEHSTLVAAASKHLAETPPIWETEQIGSAPGVDSSVAQYTGGEVRIVRDLSKIGAGTPYPHLAHLVLGLQSCSFHDKDYIPFCVMNALMGGGCHFSSGGPGKGMYTKLYTHLLNVEHWIYNATSYNHAYEDDGLYYIHASCPPQKMSELVTLITDQMLHVPQRITSADVRRACAQLKSLLLMNLEMRPVQFEDTARMIVGLGYRKSPMEFIEEIGWVRDCPQELGQGMQSVPPYEAFDECIARRTVQPLIADKGLGGKLWGFWGDRRG